MSILMGSIVGNLTAKQPDAQVIISDFKNRPTWCAISADKGSRPMPKPGMAVRWMRNKNSKSVTKSALRTKTAKSKSTFMQTARPMASSSWFTVSSLRVLSLSVIHRSGWLLWLTASCSAKMK